MALKAKAGANVAPVEAGTHVAVCIGYADLGTQHDEYEGNVTVSRKVLLFWDIPGLRIDVDGKDLPRRISKRYTLSLGKKATLRAVLESWRGRAFTPEELKGFEIRNLVGAGCMLSIVHKPKADGSGVRAEVASVMALPKGMPIPHMEVDPLIYECEDEQGNFVEPHSSLPPWVVEIITESEEFRRAHGQPPADAGPQAAQPAVEDLDVPF